MHLKFVDCQKFADFINFHSLMLHDLSMDGTFKHYFTLFSYESRSRLTNLIFKDIGCLT